MYVKRIPKTIQEKLKARERALSFSSQSTFGQEKDDGSLDIKDIGTRSVFVRMCSNKLNVPNILISGGELSSVGDTKFGVEFGLQQNGDNLYNSAIDQSGKDYGKRPIPGIKSIEVGYKGSYKAIRQATINWVVGSICYHLMPDQAHCLLKVFGRRHHFRLPTCSEHQSFHQL